MKDQVRNAVLACAITVGLTAAAHADVHVYTLDPTLSVLTQGGLLDPTGATLGAPVPMEGQDLDMDMLPDAGALMVGYSGAITADVTGSTIEILGGAATAGINPLGLMSPAPGGLIGVGPANYGGTFDAGFAGSVDLATRALSFSLSTTGPTALAGGAFAASDVMGAMDSGTVDFVSLGLISAFVGAGSVDMGSFGLTLPASPGPAMGSISVAGATEVLTIPVDIEFLIPGSALGSPVDFLGTLSGDLVATRHMPEPASLGLLAVAGGLLAGRPRRR